jgi:hypothetical protein
VIVFKFLGGVWRCMIIIEIGLGFSCAKKVTIFVNIAGSDAIRAVENDGDLTSTRY